MADPFLYRLMDFLYRGVMDNMPEVLQNRSRESAAILGAGGTYGVVRGLQWSSKNIVDKLVWNKIPMLNEYFSSFDSDVLPYLEILCIGGMTFLLYHVFIQNQGEIAREHPTYSPGMFGVYTGGVAGALQDLWQRIG